MRHPDGSLVHVAYCTNVHAAETLDGVVAQLDRFATPVRHALGVPLLGVGLWLAAPLARELRERPEELARLRKALDDGGLEVVTFNGFPYRAFQAEVVKLAVYAPDWTTAERAQYTLDLAWLLAALLPDGVTEGSISTLPLGWREGWGSAASTAAAKRLAEVALGLEELERATGRTIRVALEPEPGCVAETTAQALAALDGLDKQRLGICLDACHLAVQFESPEGALALVERAGVTIPKAQASVALRAAGDGARAELAQFVEPRFMHQTRERVGVGAGASIAGVDDLDEALHGGLPGADEWRVHFHVPVQLDGERTTQPELRELLAGLVGGASPRTRHIELETYTWDVLPAGLRAGNDNALVDGLARELRWLADELQALGLRTEAA
ncbi:MAG TPA: metabolite traffic protein EboE [Conexibacter sp.]